MMEGGRLKGGRLIEVLLYKQIYESMCSWKRVILLQLQLKSQLRSGVNALCERSDYVQSKSQPSSKASLPVSSPYNTPITQVPFVFLEQYYG